MHQKHENQSDKARLETPTVHALRGIVAALRHAEGELLRVQAALHSELADTPHDAPAADIQRLDSATQGVAGTATFTDALIACLESGGAVVPAKLGEGIRPRDLLDRLLLVPEAPEESGEPTFF